MLINELLSLSPYPSLRPGQLKIAKIVYESMAYGRYAALEAPCGLGKTLASLLGAFLSLSKGIIKKVIWLTRTNNESDKVIEEARKLKNEDASLKGLSIRGRSSSCLYLQGADEDLMHIACRALRSEASCPYLNQENIDSCIEYLDQNFNLLTSLEILEECKRQKACPLAVMKRLTRKSQIIALTYPYIFNRAIRKAYLRILIPRDGSVAAIVDEAHNLLDSVVEYNSRTLRFSTLYDSIDELYLRDEVKLAKLLEDVTFTLEDLMTKSASTYGIEIPRNVVERIVINYYENIFEYLNKMREVVLSIVTLRALKGFTIRCHTYSVYCFLKQFLEAPSDYVAWLYQDTEKNVLRLEMKPLIYDISDTVRLFHGMVFMSGTLSPIRKYIALLNLSHHAEIRIMKYVKPKYGHAFLVIDTSLSTTLKERSTSLYKRIAYKLKALREHIKGGLGVFVSSYSILQGLKGVGLKDLMTGLTIIDDHAKPLYSMESLSFFKEYVKKGFNATLISVMGGRLSEGIDIPSSIMPIAIIVGMPIPEPNPYSLKKVKKLREQGLKNPYGTVFIEPAMRKVAQTIGRLIRSPHDKATIILMDKRYRKDIIMKYMPKWLEFDLCMTDNPLCCLHDVLSPS